MASDRRAPRLLAAAVLMVFAVAHAQAAETAADGGAEAIRELFVAAAHQDDVISLNLLAGLGEWLAPPASAPAGAKHPFAALSDLDGEVENGGFSQYFFNSSGDAWPDALAALDALGDRQGRELVTAALAVFGAEKPSTDRATRQKQLERVGRRGEQEWDRLERRWWGHDADLGKLVLAWTASEGARATFLAKPERATTFEFQYLMTDAAGEHWGQPLCDAVRKHPAVRSSGAFASDMAAKEYPACALWCPRDHAQILAIDGRDPNLGKLLAATRPLATAIHVHVVVVGAMPATGREAEPTWYLHLDGTGEAEQKKLMEAVGGWCPEK